MGWPGYVIYGEDLGSAIEAVDKSLAKIKTNKYDKEDLIQLKQAMSEAGKAIDKVLESNENKD